VTRRGSLLLQQPVASVASEASHAKAPRPGRKGVPTEVPAEVPRAAPPKNPSCEVVASCEAEYIAATTASTQALWLARLLGDLLGRDVEVVELRVDSKSALALAKNPVFHERNKHIQVRYHFIRSCLEEGSVRAHYINTQDQLAVPWANQVPGTSRQDRDGSDTSQGATQDLGG